MDFRKEIIMRTQKRTMPLFLAFPVALVAVGFFATRVLGDKVAPETNLVGDTMKSKRQL